ncbi:hypothetical protein CoNPh10_CDS0116 [Staphylococcus phage S-CoN_Ph10]|nr:hypothetical protein BE22_0007 [Staphylococcus phage vB_SepS_BE22]WNM53007.1 hypothetical protein CoNPh10_CDS0116 [Staphylococcus phage S-CoN_Ph10]
MRRHIVQICYPKGFLSYSSICFHIVQHTFSTTSKYV